MSILVGTVNLESTAAPSLFTLQSFKLSFKTSFQTLCYSTQRCSQLCPAGYNESLKFVCRASVELTYVKIIGLNSLESPARKTIMSARHQKGFYGRVVRQKPNIRFL